MKTIIIFLTAVLCFACVKQQPASYTYETLLVDVTDTSDRVTSSDLSSYGAVSGSEGKCISLVLITDVHNNPKETICIDSFSDGVTANMISRNHAVNDFNNERERLFTGLDSVTYGCKESQILRAVCRELSTLSEKDDRVTKRLVVFSNLFENTDLFSVFRLGDQKKLNEPAELASFFETQYEIPDRLDDITLEIRYQPTMETEMLHDQMIELYQALFEMRGCNIQTHVEHITNIE